MTVTVYGLPPETCTYSFDSKGIKFTVQNGRGMDLISDHTRFLSLGLISLVRSEPTEPPVAKSREEITKEIEERWGKGVYYVAGVDNGRTIFTAVRDDADEKSNYVGKVNRGPRTLPS